MRQAGRFSVRQSTTNRSLKKLRSTYNSYNTIDKEERECVLSEYGFSAFKAIRYHQMRV